jgi:hypothetical protein
MVHHLSYPRPFNGRLYSLISALSYDKNEDEVTVVGVGGADVAAPSSHARARHVLSMTE